MTSEYTGRAAERGAVPHKETEVERARAELVAALSEFEDKVNIPKRIRRLREEDPGKLYAALSAAGAVAAGVVALVVFRIAHRR